MEIRSKDEQLEEYLGEDNFKIGRNFSSKEILEIEYATQELLNGSNPKERIDFLYKKLFETDAYKYLENRYLNVTGELDFKMYKDGVEYPKILIIDYAPRSTTYYKASWSQCLDSILGLNYTLIEKWLPFVGCRYVYPLPIITESSKKKELPNEAKKIFYLLLAFTIISISPSLIIILGADPRKCFEYQLRVKMSSDKMSPSNYKKGKFYFGKNAIDIPCGRKTKPCECIFLDHPCMLDMTSKVYNRKTMEEKEISVKYARKGYEKCASLLYDRYKYLISSKRKSAFDMIMPSSSPSIKKKEKEETVDPNLGFNDEFTNIEVVFKEENMEGDDDEEKSSEEEELTHIEKLALLADKNRKEKFKDHEFSDILPKEMSWLVRTDQPYTDTCLCKMCHGNCVHASCSYCFCEKHNLHRGIKFNECLYGCPIVTSV